MTNTQERHDPEGALPANDDAPDTSKPTPKPVLGQVKTDEERRLAAEIEKLLG